jgi:hypothetical protein
MVENLAEVIEHGARDQQSDALVYIYFFDNFPIYHFFIVCFNFGGLIFVSLVFFFFLKVSDLNNHFETCQHLLNSISGSINTKAMVIANSS